MKKNYTKIVFSILLTTIISVGVIYAYEGVRIKTLFQTANEKDKITPEWVNLVNNKVSSANGDSSQIVTALNQINSTLMSIDSKMGGASSGGGTNGKTFVDIQVLNTTKSGLAYCKSQGYANANIKATQIVGINMDNTWSKDGHILQKVLDNGERTLCSNDNGSGGKWESVLEI